MIKYKITKDLYTGTPNGVIRFPDIAGIPFDPANTDYQEYLKWIEEGHIPLPADEISE